VCAGEPFVHAERLLAREHAQQVKEGPVGVLVKDNNLHICDIFGAKYSRAYC
jgi:hypothetical protein